eukprot:6635940-Prymnesium_polylepis.1
MSTLAAADACDTQHDISCSCFRLISCRGWPCGRCCRGTEYLTVTCMPIDKASPQDFAKPLLWLLQALAACARNRAPRNAAIARQTSMVWHVQPAPCQCGAAGASLVRFLWAGRTCPSMVSES